MRAFALARRYDGTDEIARLESEVALDRLAVANRKAVFIRSAHLAIAVPGCLDSQGLQGRIECDRGATVSTARSIDPVRFSVTLARTVELRLRAVARLDRETRGNQCIE